MSPADEEDRAESSAEQALVLPVTPAEFRAKAHAQLQPSSAQADGADEEEPAEPPAEAPAEQAPQPSTMMPGPTLSGAEPAVVSVAGGAVLTVTGDNLLPGCALLLDAVELEVERLGLSELRATLPAHPAGTASLHVRNPDGQEAQLGDAVRFDEGPTIVAISPPRAAIAGGTEITVSGKNFQEGCTVSVLDRYSPAVELDGPEQLRFVAPPHDAPESGLVHVTNPGGMRSTEGASLFYVSPEAPTVAAVEPASGFTAGGKRVVLSGTGFQPGCVVRFGEQSAEVVCGEETSVEVAVPEAPAAGAVDVVVENPDGQTAVLAGGFTYELPPAPPKIISVAPNQGWCAGGTRVTVTGDNFDDLTVLRVGEVQCSIEQRTRTELIATTPPHETPEVVAVEVVNRERVPVRLEKGFTYRQRPAPSIADVSPSSGPTTGGTRVTIEGQNLGSEVAVRLGRQRAKLLRAQGETALLIETPPQRSAGLVDIELVSPDESTVTKSKAFKYEAAPAPTISSVAPNRCGTEGGAELTIGGKGFVAQSRVLVASKPVERVKLVDAETLEIKVPPGKHGAMVDVTVKNPDGKQAVARRAFQYDERYD
ncbi:MAG: IPT/TIG domain-containing protein [Deltaproteobacteria bacterium]|jgi:hypothetical protein|nr:IPT/TIG domain-containing protein [Deltaproteobacteria bacterium]MBW2531370.1 IPT/TIG domain-containing protein [Deltaproteobacteria bacterium]